MRRTPSPPSASGATRLQTAVLRLQRSPWGLAGGAVLIVLLAVVGLGEWLGWPFLRTPTQRLLSDALERPVRLDAVDSARPAAAADFRVRFVGGLRLQAARLEIGAPDWSSAPHMLRAHDIELALRYVDLWRAYRGAPLRIESLQASALDATLERRADGRASWQFGTPAPSPDPALAATLPAFGSLQVASGVLRYRDAARDLELDAQLALTDGVPAAIDAARGAADPPAARPATLLQLSATGRYRDLPLKAELRSSGVLPGVGEAVGDTPVTLKLDATVGRATLSFHGNALAALQGYAGRFTLKGPSLAAVGDPFGVTLPTTAAFATEGGIVKVGAQWRVWLAEATVGASRLGGRFVFDTGGARPRLTGELGGKRLALVDLGPVVGATPAGTARPGGARKLLPDRAFDLPSLRAMDADVAIDIAEVDLNTRLLEPLRPLRGQLTLAGGVLSLSELDARTAGGQLGGTLRLDGRGARALWDADLRWSGVRLERWIRQVRADDAPPYVSGRLDGRATLQGEGRSTAEILAGLKGALRTELRGGSVSHLAIEAAGLDLAQSLGVLLRGDEALPVRCAVADLVAAKGVLSPRLVVIDTSDSTVWVDGTLSLASETLDLRAMVSPKDFSPLALRAPLRVRGSFAAPEVSVEQGEVGLKLAASLLLGLLNPLAALLPLLDPGDAADAQRDRSGCQGLTQRGGKRPAAAASKPG